MKVLGEISRLVGLVIRTLTNNTVTIKPDNAQANDIELKLPLRTANDHLVSRDSTDTLTNKTIDSANNTLTVDADIATVTNIDSDNIKDGGVATIDIADDAITLEKMATDSVGTDEIIADSVGTSELAPDAVTNAELADDAVQTENIVNENVTTSKIAPDAIDNTKLADDAVQTENILNDAVVTDKILDAAVTDAKIDSVNSNKATYDNAASGLVATDAQAAIDEVEGRLDSAESAIGGNDTDIADLYSTKADKTTTVTGTGSLTGGGDLSADRTIDVADGGIGTDELADSAVTDAKVSDVAASKITGSFPELYVDRGTAAIAANSLAIPADATYITVTGTGPLNEITGLTEDRQYMIENNTGAVLVIPNSATVNNGTDGDLELAVDAVLMLYYDGTLSNVVGGSGGGGAGGLELVYINDTASPVTAEISKHYLTDSTSGAITINLPDASALSATKKKTASIRITDSSETWTDNNVTLVPSSGEKIDGFAVDESFVLDVSGSWLELSWDDDLSHWALNLSGAGGGGGGGLTIEEYAYGSLPATLELDIHYLVDFGGGSSLNASATMPAIADAGSIKVTPINDAGGCTVTLTRGSTDQFNDPDLGLDTEYVLDVGSSTFVANVNDSTWEITDAYWATAQDAGETLWQQKVLLADKVNPTGVISELSFGNLTIGKTYKYELQERWTQDASDGSVNSLIKHDGTTISVNYPNTADGLGRTYFRSTTFVATATTVTLEIGSASGGTTLQGNAADHRTYAILYELNQHTEVSTFTYP